MAGCTEHGARSRRALPSADTGQDRTLASDAKNRILLENYYLPGDLEASIGRFVDHYNHRRYHESLSNLTPADVYFGRGQTILLERERIKREHNPKTSLAASKESRINLKPDEPVTPVVHTAICLKAFDDGHHFSSIAFAGVPKAVQLDARTVTRGGCINFIISSQDSLAAIAGGFDDAPAIGQLRAISKHGK